MNWLDFKNKYSSDCSYDNNNQVTFNTLTMNTTGNQVIIHTQTINTV